MPTLAKALKAETTKVLCPKLRLNPCLRISQTEISSGTALSVLRAFENLPVPLHVSISTHSPLGISTGTLSSINAAESRLPNPNILDKAQQGISSVSRWSLQSMREWEFWDQGADEHFLDNFYLFFMAQFKHHLIQKVFHHSQSEAPVLCTLKASCTSYLYLSHHIVNSWPPLCFQIQARLCPLSPRGLVLLALAGGYSSDLLHLSVAWVPPAPVWVLKHALCLFVPPPLMAAARENEKWELKAELSKAKLTVEGFVMSQSRLGKRQTLFQHNKVQKLC